MHTNGSLRAKTFIGFLQTGNVLITTLIRRHDMSWILLMHKEQSFVTTYNYCYYHMLKQCRLLLFVMESSTTKCILVGEPLFVQAYSHKGNRLIFARSVARIFATRSRPVKNQDFECTFLWHKTPQRQSYPKVLLADKQKFSSAPY